MGRPDKVIDFENAPNSARLIRQQKGYKLTRVADCLKVHNNSLSQYEIHGDGIGRVNEIRLAFILGVEPEELMKPGKKFSEKIRQSLTLICL